MRNKVETQVEKKSLSLSQESDETLIKRAFLGDQVAFEGLVRRYRPALLSFVRRYGASDEQGEDIVQSVFLQCYLFLPQLSQHLSYKRSALPLQAWLFRVAINRCVDEARRKSPLHFSQMRPSGFNAGEADEASSLE